jgi:OmpA-OmpF porin, OOP family
MKTLALALPAAALIAASGCCGLIPGPRASAPAPAPAPADAAPADGDKDGVPDAKEQCLQSPAGSAVNAFGCPKGEKVSIALNVQFDTGKHAVKPEYDGQLSKVAEFLKSYPESRAEIEGHTDSMGSAASNTALSQRRADAVRQALIDRFGADGGRLTAKGYGPDKPLADNGTAEGRAQNRRVIATFTATKD